MAQTNISITIDEEIKNDAESLFMQLGLTLSTATDIFFRQAVRTKGIPFALTAVEIDPEMQARKEFWEVVKSIQEDSVRNGTDKMTMDEIDDIIAECRQEARKSK